MLLFGEGVRHWNRCPETQGKVAPVVSRGFGVESSRGLFQTTFFYDSMIQNFLWKAAKSACDTESVYPDWKQR